MKYIIYILLILLILFTIGCTKYVKVEPEPIIETVVKTVVVTETVIETVEVQDTECIDLIGNLNELLDNVYYVYGKNEYEDHYDESWGTGFSLEYKDKFYLITAGHIVENEYGYFPNLGFKANFSDEWIYPKLLCYEQNHEAIIDYAVFYSDKVDSGFTIDDDNDKGIYMFGNSELNINIIKSNEIKNVTGESGSPITDISAEVIGISIADIPEIYMPINTVLRAIDDLE
jgi:hypothetical protein